MVWVVGNDFLQGPFFKCFFYVVILAPFNLYCGNLQYVPPQPATPQERRAVQKVLIFKLPPQSLTIRHWKIVVGRLLSNNWGPVTFQGRAVKLPEGKPLFERSGPRFRVGAGGFSRISGSSLDAGCNSCRSQRAELWVEMELWVAIAHDTIMWIWSDHDDDHQQH